MKGVDYITPEVQEMRDRAAICGTVYGGTLAMREAGTTYLPRWPQESVSEWESRRACSVLYPALKKTIGVMIGKPLGSPIGVGDDVPKGIEAALEDVDLQGRDLDSFARDVASYALRDGITWVLVDYPMVPVGGTLADEQRLGARPYLIHIPLRNVLGWQRDSSGRLTQFRYAETIQEADGPWATQAVTQIRVWSPGSIQVHRMTEHGVYVLIDETPVTMQEIPVVAVYGERTGNWAAVPPLEDLAWLNVQHWQSSSDQRNILHKTRVPFMAADEDLRTDPNAGVTITAAGILVGFQNLRYIEHSGAAITAGRQDLLDLEDQMRRAAGELLSRSTLKTATEAGLEASEGESWLRSWARNFEDALEACLGFMAKWIGEPTGGTLSLDFDWNDTTLQADMITALTNARTSGNLSLESYLTALHDGGVLPPGRTVEEEMDALAMEGPSFSSFSQPEPKQSHEPS